MGEIPVKSMGTTLIHEHFLVDFIGADKINENRWNKDEVVEKLLPLLKAVKKHGVETIFDCTPAFLGRDIQLLKMLSKASGLHIITNTGYYGAAGNKYLPSWAYTETAELLAARWIKEHSDSIEGSGVRPGFIKIGVDGEHLSALHGKLVSAAGLTHLETGLTICSHTGPSVLAMEELAILESMDIDPSAFVWVHAQQEKDLTKHSQAAAKGVWVSLDGMGWGDEEFYASSILNLHAEGLLNRVLISHDAGWYKPGEPGGGDITGYTSIFTQMIPLLRKYGLKKKEIDQLLIHNPVNAFTPKTRKR